MLSYKQSVGVSYVDFTEDDYKKFDVEVALPQGLGYAKGMPSFIKVDSFYSKSIKLIRDKLNFAFTLQGGVVRPILGSKVTHINDRFFVTNSFGYSHLGHCFKSNNPIRE